MSKNLTKILIGVVILAVVIIGLSFYQDNEDDKNETTNLSNEEVKELSVIATIDNGSTQKSYDKKLSSGTTALGVINLVAEEDGIVLDTTEYDFGILIDSIDGVGEDVNDGKYWSFYVNDEMSMVGLSDYVVMDNDTILLKYQAL